ncbi:hypothetical protein [Demequina flava]|uniref:hypothetical protein n=1 Tax=Demequina flava TaxID=1095025 RepID=UPI00128B2045|nr:hypothetical protein [Demequina flava]
MATYVSRQWAWQNSIALGALAFAAVACGVAFTVADTWLETPWIAVASIAILVACACIPLTITVAPAGVHVSLGGVLKRDIPAADIASVTVASYRPMREFGGWGWRFGLHDKRARAYTVTGSTALVLTLHDGGKVYLGVADDRKCAEALAQVTA